MRVSIWSMLLIVVALFACDDGDSKGAATADMAVDSGLDATPPVMDSHVEEDVGVVVDPCPEQRAVGPLMITTNEELEALRGVTIIDPGESGPALVITGNEITELSALECLKFIPEGTLRIGPLPNLTSLAGLERLTQVAGLNIQENGITSLDGLQGLQELHALTLSGLESLETLDGLNPEHRVTTQITINGVSNLVDASALGPYEITYLVLARNDRLEKMPNVRLVRADLLGGLNLSSMENLRTLDGLSIAPEVQGIIEIERLPLLADLSAFEEVTAIIDPTGQLNETRLSLRHLPSITDLSALSNLQQVAGLLISNLDGLETLDDLSSLEAVNGNIWVTGNASLRSMNRLAGATIGGERINIESNESLPRCDVDALIEGWRANGYDGEVEVRGLLRCEEGAPSGG